MRNSPYDYGYWTIAVLNIVFFGLFVLAFLKPRKKAEWRSMGVFSAFITALFAEMYGFPLTIYIFSSLLGGKLGVTNPFGHANGHLWGTLLGFSDRGKLLICNIGNSFMLFGLILMGKGWWQIHRAKGALVTSGIYRYIRHPQYLGLFMIILGMLVQWPTLATILMAPILLWIYYRLAIREEKELEDQFGEVYLQYRTSTPAFLPFYRSSETKRVQGHSGY